jgi:hypothetical protein
MIRYDLNRLTRMENLQRDRRTPFKPFKKGLTRLWIRVWFTDYNKDKRYIRYEYHGKYTSGAVKRAIRVMNKTQATAGDLGTCTTWVHEYHKTGVIYSGPLTGAGRGFYGYSFAHFQEVRLGTTWTMEFPRKPCTLVDNSMFVFDELLSRLTPVELHRKLIKHRHICEVE